jgi:putative transcriptional regulator
MAMPGLSDPNFFQTVTCICEHNAYGAMGIVVNRRHEALRGREIFKELNLPHTPAAGALPIYSGGPVHEDELFILHGAPFGWDACLEVTPALGLSNTRDILEAIAQDRGPKSFSISLGCAGWGAGQLEMEIKDNAWLTHPLFEESILDWPVETRWEEALRRMGVNPTRLSDTAGHA